MEKAAPNTQAILLHGTGGSGTDYYWFADTRDYLEAHGRTVWWQKMPHTERPDLAETTEFVESSLPPLNEDTIIIAHSSGCPLALHLLERANTKVKQVVLVGGFYEPLDDDGASKLMLPGSFGWDVLKRLATEYVLVNSDNDPRGCHDLQARPAALALGGTLVVPTGQGHMGSETYNQPYPKFPLLKRLLRV